MAKFHIFLGYIVLIMTHSVSWGNLYASRNVQELENMKDLIQRLEDKLTVNEENDVYPSESEDVVAAHMEDIENSPAAIRGQKERMVTRREYLGTEEQRRPTHSWTSKKLRNVWPLWNSPWHSGECIFPPSNNSPKLRNIYFINEFILNHFDIKTC
ncbi:ventricular natriuretic peptide-like isoform X1 [Oncorhynchus keta]|uniref:ventricular natriuretic peptide-like isoform X1 n=1 Tax=Oncorhynchus keta TaxID=8018 RepID=UPI00227CA9D1|nr:ventricular natriuretic peptide-like isoform X1 [Oncorhynchus keta]